MRALTLVLAFSAAALAAGAAQAQEICLYGGPDAAADLACGPVYIGIPRADDGGAAESRILSGVPAGSQAAPQPPLPPSAASAAPAWPAPPSTYAPPAPDIAIAPLAPVSPAGPEAYAAAPPEPAPESAPAYAYDPQRTAPAYTPAPPPAPQFQSAPPAAAYAYEAPNAAPAYAPPAPEYPAPPADYAYAAPAPAYAPPPPPPSFDGYVAVDGAGSAPGAYAYAYESADGGAYAWRYETPQGPAWAYAYETPQGWAYAYAYEQGAQAGPPPAVIEARPPQPLPAPPAGPAPYRGPYVEHGAHHAERRVPGADWRYAEERLFGPSWRRQLHLVQTYYRESEWVSAPAAPVRRVYVGSLAPAPTLALHHPVGPVYPGPAYGPRVRPWGPPPP